MLSVSEPASLLTLVPAMASSSRSGSVAPDEVIELPPELLELSLRLDEKPESLATGNEDIQLAALKATKYVFDLGEPIHFLLVQVADYILSPRSSADRV